MATPFMIVLDEKVQSENLLHMLIASIILNKYQQHLFKISTLAFNILQCTLESFACGTRLFLGIQVSFSSQVRLLLLVQIINFLP